MSEANPHAGDAYAIAWDVSAETRGVSALVLAWDSRAAGPSPNVNVGPAET